jgi:hypothetical protein
LSIPLTPVIVRGSSITSVSAPLISLETLILLQSSLNSNSTLPIAPSIVSTHPQAVHSLPIAGLKKKQEKYRVALRVQCVTLLNAGIPLDVICSRFFVTKSAVYRWKRIAKARGYKPEIDPRLLCYHVKDSPRSSRPSLQNLARTRKMIKEICKNKEGRNLNCRKLRGKLKVSAMTA